MGGGASRELEREKEKASREIAEAREAAAAQENRVDELQSQLESERARSAGLEIQLKDTEEDHAYWLEQQLRLIKLVGMQNYLQSQV